MAMTDAKAGCRLFERTMKLYREGVIKPAEPLHVLKASQFPDAIRLFMNGSRLGKVVVSNNDPEEIIKVHFCLSAVSFSLSVLSLTVFTSTAQHPPNPHSPPMPAISSSVG